MEEVWYETDLVVQLIHALLHMHRQLFDLGNKSHSLNERENVVGNLFVRRKNYEELHV